MSYALAFYTVPLNELTARLAAQGTQDAQGPSGDQGAFAKQAVALLRDLGSPIDALNHSSAGGPWFRDRFIDEALGGLIGTKTAGYLIERTLTGVEWSGYPSMGWLTRDELATALKALDEADPDALASLDDPESEELLAELTDILRMAPETGQDLVTVYA